jgi:hypothetical protein
VFLTRETPLTFHRRLLHGSLRTRAVSFSRSQRFQCIGRPMAINHRAKRAVPDGARVGVAMRSAFALNNSPTKCQGHGVRLERSDRTCGIRTMDRKRLSHLCALPLALAFARRGESAGTGAFRRVAGRVAGRRAARPLDAGAGRREAHAEQSVRSHASRIRLGRQSITASPPFRP